MNVVLLFEWFWCVLAMTHILDLRTFSFSFQCALLFFLVFLSEALWDLPVLSSGQTVAKNL